jgi:hypothetical protein
MMLTTRNKTIPFKRILLEKIGIEMRLQKRLLLDLYPFYQ